MVIVSIICVALMVSVVLRAAWFRVNEHVIEFLQLKSLFGPEMKYGCRLLPETAIESNTTCAY